MTTLSRRRLVFSAAALISIAPLSARAGTVWLPETEPSDPFPVPYVDPRSIPEEFRRTVVRYPDAEWPGTLIVDTGSRHLYMIVEEGLALRYGVGVGRAGFEWSGIAEVGYKEIWPDWHP